MHLKKFIFLYLFALAAGLLILSFNDILFVLKAESQVAKVIYHVPGKTETYYKMSGSYEEKSMAPAIEYAVDGKTYTYIPKYSCKDGCQKVGSDITIFYKKERPEEVLVSSFGDMWKYKIYFLIIMAVLLITSLPYLYYTSTKQPASESNG